MRTPGRLGLNPPRNMTTHRTSTVFSLRLGWWVMALWLLISTVSCAELIGPKTLKLGHGLNVDHPVHQGMEIMAQRLAEKSDGQLLIEIYPSSQLGSERQCLELLQIGSLAMTKVSAAVMENFAPKIQVFSLPYIFRDRAHAYQVLDGPIGQELLVDSERYWLRGLTYFDAGYRSFYTKERPVHKPEDLEGLKIRVQESAVALELVRSLGGAPTPISWGELYTALQQGVVDGAENNPPSFYTSRHYEICQYYSLNEHTAVPDILAIGKVAWDRLTPQEQGWLKEAAYEATIEQRKLWQAAEQEALEAVQAEGVEVIRPDKGLFFQKTKGMLEAYRDRPEMYELIQRIQAVEPQTKAPASPSNP
jgi:tripartite ATP-independent transporter DctP family solute receptor